VNIFGKLLLTFRKPNDIAHLKEIYNSDYFITLDELPDFK